MVPEENSGRLQKPLKHRRNHEPGPCARIGVESMTRLALFAVLVMAFAMSAAAPASAMAACPDGSYVAGNICKEAPDGSYISGNSRPQMAPNGQYTSGTPVLTPKGNYVSGNGSLTRCSDGTYVMGKCKLAPDGKYIGE